MITKIYDFGAGTDFTYDPTKIEFDGTLVSLALQETAELFSQSFASSTGFTFDAAKTEFSSGVMRQKNKVPANLAAYAAWNSFLDVNYGSSGLTVTAFNSAAVSGGFLDLKGSTNKYVQLPDAYVVGNQATLAFIFKPNYSGTPSVYQIIYGNGTFPVNYFALYHSPAGTLSLDVYDSASSAVISGVSFGGWAPVAGTEYEIVLQLDITNGATKLFIDGVQFGSTIVSEGVRTAAASAFVGRDGTNSGNANFSIKSFAIYSAVVGPTGLIPLSETKYVADIITFPTFTYALAQDLVAFTAATITDVNDPTYVLNSKWWNGSIWTTSNLTAAQSNTAAEISAHIATFPASNSVVVKAFTANAAVQQSFSLFRIAYTGLLYDQTDPVIYPTVPLSIDQLSSITDVESDSIGFYLFVDSIPKYWSGSAWVTSDTTFAQTNPLTVINAHASSLDISLGAYVTPVALLHSEDGLSTPTLTTLTVIYDYFGQRPAGPNLCTIYGYIVDEEGTAVAAATLRIDIPETFLNNGLIIPQGYFTAISDSRGYIEITMYETTTAAKALNFSIAYPQSATKGIGNNAAVLGAAKIPNSPQVNISSLAFT